MKKTKQVIIPAQPAKEVTNSDGVICDLCKKHFDDEWDKQDNYDVRETEVSMSLGSHYPNGERYVDETTFDICPSCFADVLIPFLKSKGAEPTVKDAFDA